LRGIKIEVSNGVGVRYLARRTAERLATLGVVTARLTNQAGYRQSNTEIQFSDGQQGLAAALSARLPVAVSAVAVGHLERNLQLRLVLGRDFVGTAIAAWLDAESEARVALAGYDGWRWS
jgi:hypothetical protein